MISDDQAPLLNGTHFSETIDANANTIDAAAGDDVVNAGAGTDLVRGGDGNDTLYGIKDADTLYNIAGVVGSSFADVITGNGRDNGLVGGIGAADMAIVLRNVSGFSPADILWD